MLELILILNYVLVLILITPFEYQVRNLDLAAYTELSDADKEKNVQTKFHLMSSTQHDGQPESGTYRTYVHFKANDQWYDIPLPPHAPCSTTLCFAQEPYSLALPHNHNLCTPLQVRHPGPTRQWRPPAAHLGIRVVYPVLRLVDIIGQHRVVSLLSPLPAS